jgi:glucose-6-phosphate 1-dehydrogenase
VRDRKVELLHAVGRLTPEEVDAKTVRARYTGGLIAGSAVPSYVDEVGVDPARETETFAQVELSIDNERWADVPFVLRTGKAMERDRFEISVYFRPLALLGYPGGTVPAGNMLRLYFEPASITLSLAVNAVGDLYAMEPVDLMAELTPSDLPPYARILRGILQGQMELAVRDDEAEASWSIVEPIVDAWARGHSPLREYAAGTQMDDTQSDGLG